jgi:GNAT superfamily N-acetyltransferase
MLAVRRLAAGDVPALAAIVSSLPDYFTEDVAGQVERDCAVHPGWVLAGAAGVTGFAVAARRSPGAAEILWIAVGPAWRGRGAGTMLLDHLLGDLAAEGVSLVEAKTLDRSAGYRPYEATRAFWERRGFVQVDMIDPLPGWEPGNPAAIYVAALRSTR